MNRNNKETPDYQLDLTPFISLLSVCICFLLLTVTWFQVGALSVKQAQGGEPESRTKKEEPSRLWIYMNPKKQIEVYVKRGGRSLSRKLISNTKNTNTEELDWNFQTFYKHIVQLKKSYSDLEEVFILPSADILYENIVKVMDELRQEELFSIGLIPL